MAEYIEREKVLKLIGNFKRDDVTKHCVDYAAGWNEALEQIECNVAEDIPAANVRPERHGKWEKSCDGYSYFCSICKEEPDRSGRLLSDFCPWCGAKMDRKGNDT